jgi:hypothetical protein
MSVISAKAVKTQPVYKIAFAGPICAGKTSVIDAIFAKLNIDGIDVVKTSMKFPLFKFTEKDDYATLQKLYEFGVEVEPDFLVKRLKQRLCNDLKHNRSILVDDLTQLNEVIALKSMGFTIFYLDPPWHTRLNRLKERYTRRHQPFPVFSSFVDWFTNKNQLSLESVSDEAFDHMLTSGNEIREALRIVFNDI